MAPDSEQCERGGRGARGAARVLPGAAPAPARAWLEPARESRRLLPPPAAEPGSLQAGLTLGVWTARPPKKHGPALLAPDFLKPKEKTKSQKRKERILAALKPPYFILSMIVVMVVVHMWSGRGGAAAAAAALEWSPTRWWREPWRLLSYGCVHATDAHLALNALVALAVGWCLEREQGAWRVAAVWGGGAAGGALGAGALQPAVHVVGASAAVYALLTAHLPNVCYRMGHIPLWWFRPLSVVVLAASEGCWALLRGAHPAAPAPAAAPPALGAHAHAPAESHHTEVAWSAHIFGAAVGVPIAFLVFTGEHKSTRHILAARILAAAVLLAMAALASVYYGVWQPEPARPPGVRELTPHRL